jgi:hypothetical protein
MDRAVNLIRIGRMTTVTGGFFANDFKDWNDALNLLVFLRQPI